MFFDRILAYTLVLLAIFQCDLVSARSQFRDSATPDAISNLQTNAARMAAGLNPLRPRNLFIPSRVGRSYNTPIFIRQSVADVSRSSCSRQGWWASICSPVSHELVNGVPILAHRYTLAMLERLEFGKPAI